MWDAGRPGAVPRSLASTSASAPAPATAPGVTTPVTVAPVVDPEVARAAATTPGETLVLLVSLAQPADAAMRHRLAALGQWSFPFSHVAVAAVRLPAARLGALRALPGVRGGYSEAHLPVSLDGTADAADARPACDQIGATGAGVTAAVAASRVAVS